MIGSRLGLAVLLAFATVLAASGAGAVDHPDLFRAWSPDFPDNGILSSDNASGGTSPRGPWTCGGKNIAPAIAWSGAPSDTKSFAVIMDDPDAASGRGGNHWIVYDIAASASGIARGAKEGFAPGDTGRDGGYHGPCAEPGAKAHHFLFYVYALDLAPGVLPRNLTKAEFMTRIQGHNTAEASVAAVYQRAPDGAALSKVE